MDIQNIFSELQDPTRQELVGQIIQKDPSLSHICRVRFLALWFCEISTLRDLVSLAGSDNLYHQLRSVPLDDIPGIFAGLKRVPESTKRQKRGRSSSQTHEHKENGEQGTGNPGRSFSVKNIVLRRDKAQCILTKHGRPGLHVCHIAPNKLNGSEREESWRWLRYFWGDAKANAWREEILGKNHALNTENPQNMLCLSPDAHTFWDLCICAFRPISVSDDKRSMELAFHWLPLQDRSIHRADTVPIDGHLYPNQPKGFCDSPGENIKLYIREDNSVISSGEVFTLTTDDPENAPLPSFHLLEMQWHLRRIAAMQGAAEYDDSDTESDDDDSFSSSRSSSRSYSCS